MIRILHIETGRHLYGGAQQVLYLLRGMAGKPFENHLICPAGSAIAREAETLGVCVHPLPMYGDADVVFGFRLLRLLRRFKPDVIHVHSRRGADFQGGIAARLAGVRSIVTRRVDNPEARPLGRFKYNLYDRVVAISDAIYELLRYAGVSAGKMTTIPSAVDLRLYRPDADRKWFQAEFGLAPDAVAIGMVAQFIERKGHIDLIRAAGNIRNRFPTVKILLFGRGPLAADIRRAVTKERLENTFLFCGFRSDLHRVLPCLEILVHPARMEGLGVSLLQAAASGVPIVAASAGGIPEIVENGENGYLVPPGDHRALAEAVLHLLDDPQAARSFGSAGRQLVQQRFSIPAMVAGYESIYRELART